MAKRKLVVELDINAQIISKDLAEFEKTFKRLSSSQLVGESTTTQVKALKKRVKEIKQMLDPTKEAFIDQSSVEGANKVRAYVNEVYQALKKIKSNDLGDLKVDMNDKELKAASDRINKLQENMARLSEEAKNVVGFKNVNRAESFLRGQPNKGAKADAQFYEFEKIFGKTAESIGEITTGNSKNPAAVLKQLIAIRDEIAKDPQNEDTVITGALKESEQTVENVKLIKSFLEGIDTKKLDFDNLKNTHKDTKSQSTKYQASASDITKETKNYDDRVAALEKEIAALKELVKVKENEAAQRKANVAKVQEENQESQNAAIVKQQESETIQKLIDRYLSFGAILALVKKLVNEAYTALSNLDKAFVEMAVVTEYSKKEIWGFYDSFKGIAEISGFTTAQVASVTAEYLKQGETLKDSLILTEAASQAAQIAGIAPLESVKYLTSAVRGYRLEAEDAMLVSDKFAAVAAATATDYDGLATAMSKVAAQAYANGVEMDNLMGLLSTAMDVTQEAPENIGTAFKTIFARMTQISDYGKTLEDGVDMNKVENALKLVNVSLRDTEGNIRNLDDVLLETGAGWENLTSTQKAYITNTLAGTRQQTRLLAVFENYDKLLANIATSQDAAGATAAQQSKYMEGLAAAQNKVNVAWENLIQTVANSETFISALEQVARLLESTAEVLGSPVWGTLAKIGVGLFSIKAATAGISKLSSFFELDKGAVAGWTSFLGKIGKGIKEASEGGLTVSKLGEAFSKTAEASGLFTGGKVVAEGAKVGLTATLGATAAALGGVAIAVTGAAVAFKYFSEDASRRSQKLNEEIIKIEGNLYNLNATKKGLTELADEFTEINSKVVKTTEDLERLDELLELINQYSTEENPIDLKPGNTTANELIIKDLLERSNADILAAEEELMEAQRKLFENYTKNQKKIAKDLGAAADYLVKEYFDSDLYERMGTLTGGTAQAMAEEVAQNAPIKKVKVEQGTGYTMKNVIDYEAIAVLMQEIQDKVFAAEDALANIDNTNLSEMAATLEEIMGDDIDTLTTNSPIAKLVMDNRDLSITLSQLQEMAPILNTIGSATDKWDSATKKTFYEQMKLGTALEYMSNNTRKLGVNMSDIVKVSGLLANNLNSITTENVVSSVENFEKLGDELNSINEILENNEWGAEGLSKVLDLMTAYPDLSEQIINSITNEKVINQETKEAILQANKQQTLASIDMAIAEAKAKIEYLEIEQEALANMLKDDAAATALAEKGKIDLSEMKTENILGFLEQEGFDTAKALRSQVLMYEEAYKQVQTMKANALKEGGVVSADPTNIKNTYVSNGVTQSSPLEDRVASITKQLEERLANVDRAIKSETSYVAALEKTKGAIDKLALGDVTGKSKTSSGSSGSGSGATEKAEEYLGVLNKIYVAEQRVKAADLFMSKSNELLEYARSLEAIGGNLEDLGYGFTSSAQILEEQYSLYGAAIEQQEHLIAVSKEYQTQLLSNLSPALQKTFKVINGRIIPVSKEYGKLSAENMEIVDNFAKSFEEYTDKIEGATSASIGFKTSQQNLLNDMRDAVIEWQELMIEAITNEEQKYLDSFGKMIEANKKYLNERKKLYQDSFSAEDTESELNNIEQERLTLTEKIAALEGAHDQQSLKRKAEYTKSLEDLNKQYQELTLQYNRDAFLQRIDDQVAYQDEVFQKEEEAFNERIADAEYLEMRIKEITNKAKADALIEQGLHNMNLKELIDAGYITQEQATSLGLTNMTTTISNWSAADKQALQQHMTDNTDILEKAWGTGTAGESGTAEAIVKAATDNIVDYLKTNLPEATGATELMSQKSVQHWTALTKAMGEYTDKFNGLKLTAPDSTELNKSLTTIVQDFKKAAEGVELHWSRIKAASDSVGGPGSTPGGGLQKQVSYTGTLLTSTSRGGVFSIKGSDGSTHRYTNDTTGVKLDGVPTTVAELRKKFPNISWKGGKGFKTGGTTERTGLHWLDGTPGRPERVLSPGANKEFEQMLGSLTAESRLRAESYTNAASDERLKEISQRLQQLSEVIVDSDEASTSKLARGLQKVAEVIEDTNTTSGSRILSTLTVNKKF